LLHLRRILPCDVARQMLTAGHRGGSRLFVLRMGWSKIHPRRGIVKRMDEAAKVWGRIAG
jgi:hypothetical protein